MGHLKPMRLIVARGRVLLHLVSQQLLVLLLFLLPSARAASFVSLLPSKLLRVVVRHEMLEDVSLLQQIPHSVSRSCLFVLHGFHVHGGSVLLEGVLPLLLESLESLLLLLGYGDLARRHQGLGVGSNGLRFVLCLERLGQFLVFLITRFLLEHFRLLSRQNGFLFRHLLLLLISKKKIQKKIPSLSLKILKISLVSREKKKEKKRKKS